VTTARLDLGHGCMAIVRDNPPRAETRQRATDPDDKDDCDDFYDGLIDNALRRAEQARIRAATKARGGHGI